jgi:hypothetical protein
MNRRALLTGLLAAPAIVAIGNLMPLRGIKYDPMMHVRSWPFDAPAVGEWWRYTGPLSKVAEVESAMREMFGQCYTKLHEYPSFAVESSRFGIRPEITKPDVKPPPIDDYLASLSSNFSPERIRRIEEYRNWYRPHHEANTNMLKEELSKIARWGV